MDLEDCWKHDILIICYELENAVDQSSAMIGIAIRVFPIDILMVCPFAASNRSAVVDVGHFIYHVTTVSFICTPNLSNSLHFLSMILMIMSNCRSFWLINFWCVFLLWFYCWLMVSWWHRSSPFLWMLPKCHLSLHSQPWTEEGLKRGIYGHQFCDCLLMLEQLLF